MPDMTQKKTPYLKIATQTVIALGLLITLGSLIYASQGLKGLFSVMGLWVLLPYVLMFTAVKFARTQGTMLVTLLLSILSGTAAGFTYYNALMASKSSTGALAFLSVPLLQTFAAVLLWIVLLSIGSKTPGRVILATIAGAFIPLFILEILAGLIPRTNVIGIRCWSIYIVAAKFFGIPLLSCLGAWLAYRVSEKE